MKRLYVQKAPNGTWLVLVEGSPDKLVAITRTKARATEIAQRGRVRKNTLVEV